MTSFSSISPWHVRSRRTETDGDVGGGERKKKKPEPNAAREGRFRLWTGKTGKNNLYRVLIIGIKGEIASIVLKK